MSRPRRGTEAVFYDTFADWEIEDQASALRVLEQLHRQTKRNASRLAIGGTLEVQLPSTWLKDELENNNAAVDKPKGKATGKMGFA